jgi:hypothetical protein
MNNDDTTSTWSGTTVSTVLKFTNFRVIKARTRSHEEKWERVTRITKNTIIVVVATLELVVKIWAKGNGSRPMLEMVYFRKFFLCCAKFRRVSKKDGVSRTARRWFIEHFWRSQSTRGEWNRQWRNSFAYSMINGVDVRKNRPEW